MERRSLIGRMNDSWHESVKELELEIELELELELTLEGGED